LLNEPLKTSRKFATTAPRLLTGPDRFDSRRALERAKILLKRGAEIEVPSTIYVPTVIGWGGVCWLWVVVNL